ncbi:hypothetical protein AMTR_s00029p00225720 [Amborella trichopoda]|uniref:Cytochrome P450 n=1 Tax=Amborella trichopoda TaxID=13333 RepID=W1PR69_AMBTC|nr:hypothetical protein AMTR_s00029p00225720 [Amborella trichopoda]
MDSFSLLLLLLLLSLLSAYLLWFLSLSARLSGPRVWPFLGSLPSLFLNRRRLHDWIASNLKNSPTLTYQTCICPLPFLSLKQGLVTVTANPKNLEHILKTRFENYPKGPHWQAAFHDLLGSGIFNSDGESWVVQRKTAALEFTTRTLKNSMARWVNRAIKLRLWCILDRAQTLEKAVNLQDLLLRLTFDNICGLAFGKDPETLSPDFPLNPFSGAFDKATETTLQRLLYPEFLWKIKKIFGLGMEPELNRCIKVVDDYLTEIIASRKEEIISGTEPERDDLLSRFMKRKDINGNHYTNLALRRIALNFILAGRDTSSVALSWFFWLLTRNREIERKVLAEIAETLTKSRGPDTNQLERDPGHKVEQKMSLTLFMKNGLMVRVNPRDLKAIVV